jgi:DNA-binding transcriptional LysR family regulator
VAETNWIASVPEILARYEARRLPLSLAELLFRMPAFAVSLLWHVRSDHNLAHRWMRLAMKESIEAVTRRVVA